MLSESLGSSSMVKVNLITGTAELGDRTSLRCEGFHSPDRANLDVHCLFLYKSSG
jgi:hypothetical protein